MYISLHGKCQLFLSILIRPERGQHSSVKNILNIKFHENPSRWRQVVPCGQTNGHDEFTAAVCNFVSVPKDSSCNSTFLWQRWILRTLVRGQSEFYSTSGCSVRCVGWNTTYKLHFYMYQRKFFHSTLALATPWENRRGLSKSKHKLNSPCKGQKSTNSTFQDQKHADNLYIFPSSTY